MADLISRAVLLRMLDENSVVFRGEIEKMPAVDAVPVVHARWKDNGNETVSCSRCATWFPKEREPYLLYCGCCSARMDGERREQ